MTTFDVLLGNVLFLRMMQEIDKSIRRPGSMYHPVSCIGLLRSLTGCGLKEGNEFMDKIMSLDIQLYPDKGWVVVTRCDTAIMSS
jgi:hypothetical protein